MPIKAPIRRLTVRFNLTIIDLSVTKFKKPFGVPPAQLILD